MSKRLKEQYPDEMTIVLQYQFWDLQVTNDRFEVKLSFGSVPEKLVVPFQAVKAFYDPSAQFGLQFGKQGAANDVARQHMATAMPDLVADVDEVGQQQRLPPSRARSCRRFPDRLTAAPAQAGDGAGNRRRGRAARSFPQEIARLRSRLPKLKSSARLLKTWACAD